MKHHHLHNHARGQIMTEYVIMLVLCMLVAVMLMGLFYYFDVFGSRTMTLIGTDYP